MPAPTNAGIIVGCGVAALLVFVGAWAFAARRGVVCGDGSSSDGGAHSARFRGDDVNTDYRAHFGELDMDDRAAHA